MRELLLGTNNPSKLVGMREMIGAVLPEFRCVSPAQLGLKDVLPPEDEPTAIGNARAKALVWHQACDLPVIAEDSGLVFLDLPADHPDQPGVRVRRANGSDWMDDDTMLAWYAAIAHRHGGRLRACWQDAWCIIDKAGVSHDYVLPEKLQELYAFQLVDTPCQARTVGWPLDSISVHPELGGRYKAEMTDADYRQLSRLRAAAVAMEKRQHLAWIKDVLMGAE